MCFKYILSRSSFLSDIKRHLNKTLEELFCNDNELELEVNFYDEIYRLLNCNLKMIGESCGEVFLNINLDEATCKRFYALFQSGSELIFDGKPIPKENKSLRSVGLYEGCTVLIK